MTKTHKTKLKNVRKAITSAKTVLLATHENPDEDGLGAMLAFLNWLYGKKKTCVAWTLGSPPQHLSFLPKFNLLTQTPPPHADVLVAFDYGSFARLKLERLPSTPPFIITLDHHPRQTQKGDIDITDPSFSSASEIAYHFFKENRIPLTKDIATCILAGIVADTGGFIHSNTSVEVFRIAAELKALGADTELISKRTLGIASPGAARAIGLAFSRLTVDKESGVMYSYISSEDLKKEGADWDEIDPLVNMMNHIQVGKAVTCIALFKDKDDGMISVSFRSDPHKGHDARRLAEVLGGGGHQFAAAARIKGTLQETIEAALTEAKRTMNGHVAK